MYDVCVVCVVFLVLCTGGVGVGLGHTSPLLTGATITKTIQPKHFLNT